MTALDPRRLAGTRRLLGLALAAAATVLATGPTAAAQVTFDDPVDYVSYAPVTSAACGFAVYAHHWGTVMTRLITTNDGAVRREADGSSGLHVEWFAPSTGKHYAFPIPGMLQTTYTGNTPGDPAQAVLVGLQDGTPGAKQVGRAVIPAVFVGFGPYGIPDIDFTGPPLSIVGTWTIDIGATIAARCAALS